jgi:hypothetical protein
MADAIIVATTRVARAVSEISDRIKVLDVSADCVVNYEPPTALDGAFSDLQIPDNRMEFFRAILADRCPEIREKIMDRVNFPLRADMAIQVVIENVQALLLNSPRWHGECMPNIG